MNARVTRLLVSLLAAGLLVFGGACLPAATPEPTDTSTAVPTATVPLAVQTATFSPTPSPTATRTPAPTASPAPTRNPTPAPTSASRPVPTASPTPPALSASPTQASGTPTLQELSAIFFDVGESGDGFLVATWEDRYMLVDGGRRRSGIVDRLTALNVPRIDILVATNPDADHIGGLIDVLKTMPVSEVVLSGDINTTITFEDFTDAVEASGAKVTAVRRGDVLHLGTVPIDVLHPSEPFFPNRNNNSVVLRLQHGQVSFLLTGDVESQAERDLVRSGINLRSTILKLAHHGSRTSTSAAFLAAVDPEVAVYQAGTNNRYGHPVRCAGSRAWPQRRVMLFRRGDREVRHPGPWH